MLSPSAFAVLRLITSSKLVGCSIGKSAGLAPRRIGMARRGESVGQRKDFRTHQQVGVLGSDRMPTNTIRGDSDFRYKICTRQRDPLRRRSAKGDTADDPILLADLTTVSTRLPVRVHTRTEI
jgi:hypothetical protein